MEVCISILEDIYSEIKDPSGYVNSVLSTNRRIDKKIELNTRTVFKALYQSYIKQLGIAIINYTVCIQCYTIKRIRNITI